MYDAIKETGPVVPTNGAMQIDEINMTGINGCIEKNPRWVAIMVERRGQPYAIDVS